MTIGVTYTGDEIKHTNYVQWLRAGEPVKIIKLSAADPGNSLRDCDGVVFSGGIDIDPKFYGGHPNYPSMPSSGFNTQRDQFEWSLLSEAIERGLPLLGICRGLQLINIFFNGTLVQHITEEDILHRGGPDKKHLITVSGNSLLMEIAGTHQGDVNSAHHQAIAELGEGLMVNCRSEDEIIEGIEWEDKKKRPFMIAVQWHPERMSKFQLQHSPLTKNLRDKFVHEITLNQQHR